MSSLVASLRKRIRALDRFVLVSWGATLLLVIGLLGATFWWKSAGARPSGLPVEPTAVPGAGAPGAGLPSPTQATNPVPAGLGQGGMAYILRHLQLKTNIPERPRYTPLAYHVARGDAMLAIAEQFKLKPESILYVNKAVLDDNPHNLRPGMELLIPPVDGLYYEWKEGDTIEAISQKFDAETDAVIDFPGNQIDLTNPIIEPGQQVMIPGGSRDLRDWTQDLQTAGRSNTGSTGTSDFGSSACGGGLVGSGFGWPANNHSISGNGYGPGHLGIDIAANEGEPAYAASAGVVSMSQGGYNYGYGDVIQIDHGNGYVSVYAHLSQRNVGPCDSVGQGTLIGLAGSTGNAFGSHLHFEIRYGGANVNPLDIVQ